MEAALAALAATDVAQAFRASRWGYAAVNGLHILGIALLVGAILPLDLRLLGLWPGVPRAALARVLAPCAAAGLALALVMGGLLFAVRAPDYAAMTVVQVKLALVATGATAALVLHALHGLWLAEAPAGRLRAHATLSLTCWLGALACGRAIGFVG
jgi:hypothetical protein